MDQSRKSSSGNMDERIHQYAEELMRAYRRQNPSPFPFGSPRNPPLPFIPAEPVRGEIPAPAGKTGDFAGKGASIGGNALPAAVSGGLPIFHKPIRPASPPKPSPPPADRREQETELSAHSNPGVTLRPVLPVPPAGTCSVRAGTLCRRFEKHGV